MTTRRDVLRVAGTASLAALVGASAASPARSAAVDSSPRTVPLAQLRSATHFVDSVATNAHWGYYDTNYHIAYDRVKDLLARSGIRHVRSWSTERAADLRGRGLLSTALIDSDMNGRGDPAQMLESIKPLVLAGHVVAVEGPNEPDLFWKDGNRSYKGLRFPAGPKLWQEDLYRAVKADPATARLKVIGMSFGGTYWGGGHPYRWGELASSCDWGNFHPYPSGNPYTDQYPYAGIQQYYADSTFPSAALDLHPLNFDTYRPPFASKQMVATETGYSTWKWGQSERTQGRYMPRLYAENFRLGIARTYGYEFIDLFNEPAGEERDRHFGLLRNDLSPKPAYRAVASMMAAVRGDLSGVDVTRNLRGELRITPPAGYDAIYLHHLALQRRDGTVVVVLWHEVSSEDQVGLDLTPKQPTRELSHPAMLVTLTLERPVPGMTATSIDDDGNLQTRALATSGASSTVLVGDRLSFITIPPT